MDAMGASHVHDPANFFSVIPVRFSLCKRDTPAVLSARATLIRSTDFLGQQAKSVAIPSQQGSAGIVLSGVGDSVLGRVKILQTHHGNIQSKVCSAALVAYPPTGSHCYRCTCQ